MNRGWCFLALGLCLAGCGGSDDTSPDDGRTDADAAEEVTTPDVEADGPGDVDATSDVEPDVEPDVPEATDEVEPEVAPEAEVTPEASEDGTGPGDSTAETFDGVECGPTLTCMPPDELCCARGFGTTSPTYECIASTATCDDGLLGTCDGPEDCEGVCCLSVVYGTGGTIVSGTTSCNAADACGGLTSVVVCRAPTDCPTTGALCCPAPDTFGLDSGYCWSITGTCPF